MVCQNFPDVEDMQMPVSEMTSTSDERLENLERLVDELQMRNDKCHCILKNVTVFHVLN